MERTNLLYVITKLELGGAQKQLLGLIRKIERKNFRVFLFCAREGYLINEAAGIAGLVLKPSRFLERPINLFKDAFALVELISFIRKNRIQIVHTHSSKAGILGRLAARLAGTEKIIHTVHGWPFHRYQSCFLRWLYIQLERLTGRITDRIIVVSQYDQEQGLFYRIGSPEKYMLIRYGIDYAECNPGVSSGIREELGINGGELVVCNISCLKPQKAPLDFIRFADLLSRRIPQIKFLLVGDGALRRKTERLICRLNLEDKVILCGWRRGIPEILSLCDIFVLTSLWEGLPVSVLEALASAKPVVATNTGGIAEVVSTGINGFLVPCRDMPALAEAAAVLLEDKGRREKMAQDAGNSPRLTIEDMAINTQRLYNGSRFSPADTPTEKEELCVRV